MVCLLQVNQKRPELARMNAEEEEQPGTKSGVERCVSRYNSALHLPRGGGFQRCSSDAFRWQSFPQPIANGLPSARCHTDGLPSSV